MNTKEAIQAMLDGKKVRCKEWEEEDYIQFNGIHFSFKNGMQFYFGSLEYDWKIYEEQKPVQTVTIEKWLCKCIFDVEYRIIETSNIKLIGSNYEKVKLLDTHEVTL